MAQPCARTSSCTNIAPAPSPSVSTDGAHPLATPVVPCAHATTGLGDAESGATTSPLATAGRPSSRVVV